VQSRGKCESFSVVLRNGRSRNNSVYIANKPSAGLLIQWGARDFSLLPSVQTRSGAHPTFY